MPPAEFVEVPNISGLSREEAERVLDEAGFFCSHKRQIRDIPGAPVVQSGRVITTNPAPGSRVPPGSQIVFYTKLSGLLAITSALAAAALLVVLGIVLFSVLTPDNIVQEPPKVEEPKAPDESKVVRPGSDQRAGGLTVVPTFFKDSVGVGSEIRSVEVTNASSDPVKANFYFIPISGNTPDGIPEFKLTGRTLMQGKKVVTINRSRATISPGGTTKVRMKVVGDPGIPEYYGALLVETGREDKTRASDPLKSGVQIRVNNIFQIAATRVLEFRPNGSVSGRVEQIRPFQDEESQGIGFAAKVRNTGEVLAGAIGTVSLFDAEGNLVKEAPLGGSQGILPGDYREVQTLDKAFQKLSPGSYTVQVDAEMGERASQARWQFSIDENGNLPTPGMRAAARPNPYRPGVKQPFGVDVEILNTGTAEYTPQLDMRIVPYGQENILEKQSAEMSRISPGDRARDSFAFEGLPKIGNYEFIAEIRSDEGVYVGQVVASVLVGEEDFEGPGTWDQIRDWMSANPIQTMLLGAALLVFLLGGAFGFIYWRLGKKHR